MALNYFNRRELKTPTATRSRELPLPIRADRRDGRDPGVWSECRKRPRGRNGHAWRRQLAAAGSCRSAICRRSASARSSMNAM
jgi:hypothetical protein